MSALITQLIVINIKPLTELCCNSLLTDLQLLAVNRS